MPFLNNLTVTLFLLLGGNSFIPICLAEKILFLLPLSSRSHVHIHEPLIRSLGEKGHEVVSLSPIVSADMPPTVRHIQLITSEEFMGSLPNPFDQRKSGTLSQVFNTSIWNHMQTCCEKVTSHPKLHHLLKNEQFDLIVVSIYRNFCVLGVAHLLKAPTIFMSTLAPPNFITSFTGNRLPPSFIPNIYVDYSDKMSLKERLINSLLDTGMSIFWRWTFSEKFHQFSKKNLPGGETIPPIDEITKNVSMIFANGHFTVTYPRRLLPDLIEVGGMHTRPARKLPKELDNFLSGSGEEGFIYFSLGSVVQPQQMPEETRKVFFNVFGRLKQRVLWKWNAEEMTDLPENVKLGKWLPQQDILGHPKIKVFITHGGLLSTQESVYHGVPILGLPIFGDQDLNIRQAEKNGYAKFIQILGLTEPQLETALTQLLNNPSYSAKAKELSKLVKDLPQTPVDKAVYWAEYVMRHKGAVHLRSAARNLNFWQYYLLDIVAVIFTILTVVALIVFHCCKCYCSRIIRRNRHKFHQTKRD